ncbi:hypothetical protein [Pseudoalteromonas gelatinilytica]|uniref:DUF4376 domain-containing protein n=1 Tax=Pseudoalteromonas gelatinilytica TaxID=1703256 RepID=A0ABQ1TTS2_9GAMM|nr:hypothetical protein [Pseudoalteromonas profundi]GGF00909.1 hypothetical protein GCM10008027_27250 [Pseudoalteromonas profundi]
MHNKILEFILLDENNEPILSDLGLPTLKTGHVPKTEKDLLRVISLGQPVNVINAFAQEFIDSEQWEWASKYYDYLVELNEAEQYNANLPDPIPTEDGTLIEVEPKALPTEPVRPAVRTVDEVLEPYKVTIFKLQRQSQIDNAVIEISTGKTFDADEQSITRMANALIKHWQLAEDDTIPWSTADVPTGVMVECTKAEIVEAHSLATDHFATAWNIK